MTQEEYDNIRQSYSNRSDYFGTMPSKHEKGKSAKKEPVDFGGQDPTVMMSLMKKIPRNPLTSKVDLLDIMKYMEEHPSDMDDLMSEMDKHEAVKPTIDFENYDYQCLARNIVHESFWVIQIESMGFVDRLGKPVDHNEIHSATVIQPTFIIYCYDEQGAYRITEECTGLPDSKFVLRAIQRAMIEPTLPLKPCLPWLLLVSIKLSQHADTLKPFLDSLPSPFHWRFETRQEAEGVRDGVHTLNEQGFQTSMKLAEKAKEAGNKAFSSKDRNLSIKAYSDALGHIVDALSQNPDDEKEKKANNLRAICYSNRAAAYLLPGAGQDLNKALSDGAEAEKVCPSYAKAYIRQASANQLLGKVDDAMDILALALGRKELENDKGLVDRLIDLQTDGRGFSQDEATFKDWMLDILINDKRSSERLRGLQGEWKNRCNAHFGRWK